MMIAIADESYGLDELDGELDISGGIDIVWTLFLCFMVMCLLRNLSKRDS